MSQEPWGEDPPAVTAAVPEAKLKERALTRVMQSDPQVPLAELMARVKTEMAATEQCIALAIQATRPDDWQRLGNRPYLTASGVQRIARMFRVSFDHPVIERREDEINGRLVISFECIISGFWNGMSSTDIGAASTEKDFYRAKDKADGTAGNIASNRLDDVMKHSVTNAKSRVVKALLGLNGLTWEEVQKGLGVTAAQVNQVHYKTSGTAPITVGAEAKQTELWAMLMDIAHGDVGLAKEILRQKTTFTGKDGKEVPGIDDPRHSRLVGKDGLCKGLGFLLPKIKDEWNKQCFKAPVGENHVPQDEREPGQEG